jgi:hypothetical protein
MSFNPDILAGINETIATSANMNEAGKGGGGEYVPPAAGPCQLRLIGYIETGLHADEYDGKPKNTYEVQLIWELSGPNHQPKVLEDGTKLPHRMTMFLSAAQGGYHAPLNEKATLYKLFKRLNYDGKATHFAQLVGKGFLGTVIHKPGADGKPRAYLKGPDGITVQPPRFVNPIDGTTVDVNVAPPVSELRVFLWNAQGPALKAMWDSLHIGGSYPAQDGRPAKSKNVLQNKIKEALNFKASPIFQYLQTSGYDLTLGEAVGNVSTTDAGAAAPAATARAADPLADVDC